MFENKKLLIKESLKVPGFHYGYNYIFRKFNLGIWGFINEIHSVTNPGSVLMRLLDYEGY